MTYARSVLKAMLGDTSPGSLPAEFVATDRILQRWSSGNGDGLPSSEWDDTPKSKPVPLDDDTWLVVDEQIRTCPPKTRTLIRAWYCTPVPTKLIAERLGMSRYALIKGWHLSLNFMKYRLEGTRNPTIVRLLNVRTDGVVAFLQNKT